jgi:hypothetical protein
MDNLQKGESRMRREWSKLGAGFGGAGEFGGSFVKVYIMADAYHQVVNEVLRDWWTSKGIREV